MGAQRRSAQEVVEFEFWSSPGGFRAGAYMAMELQDSGRQADRNPKP